MRLAVSVQVSPDGRVDWWRRLVAAGGDLLVRTHISRAKARARVVEINPNLAEVAGEFSRGDRRRITHVTIIGWRALPQGDVLWRLRAQTGQSRWQAGNMRRDMASRCRRASRRFRISETSRIITGISRLRFYLDSELSWTSAQEILLFGNLAALPAMRCVLGGSSKVILEVPD